MTEVSAYRRARSAFRSALGFTFFVLLALPASGAQINTYDKLEITADDGSFSVRLLGRIQMDGNFYRSHLEGKEIPSGTFARRARIGFRGNFREWEYEVEFDAATNRAALKDAHLRRVMGGGKFSIGQFKVMESLEQMASSNDLILIERPYVSQATPDFKMAVGYNATAGRFGYSANIYNTREASQDEDRPTSDGVGAVGRAYIAPVNRKTIALHFGGSYAHESSDKLGRRVRVSPLGRAQEYEDGTEFRFELFDRRDQRARIHRAIGEVLAVNGPLTLQGEFLKGAADTGTTAYDRFTAWYAQASYVLTGEAREYSFRRGNLDRPKPSREFGAFEVAARYQQADREEVDGAVLRETEFGLTYYANANVRFMVNYGWAENELSGDKPRLLSTRAQFDF